MDLDPTLTRCCASAQRSPLERPTFASRQLPPSSRSSRNRTNRRHRRTCLSFDQLLLPAKMGLTRLVLTSCLLALGGVDAFTSTRALSPALHRARSSSMVSALRSEASAGSSAAAAAAAATPPRRERPPVPTTWTCERRRRGGDFASSLAATVPIQTRATPVRAAPTAGLRFWRRDKVAVKSAAVAAPPSAPSLKPYIEKLVAGESLTKEEAKEVCGAILQGADQIQVASCLMLMRRNGETPAEVAGFVAAMKEACVPVAVEGKMLDIVGTGGDGAHTINISTAAALLAAACGCKTAKAGNRSVSSQCGSADVLEALGISMALTAENVGECVAQCGMGFMFAPVNHPAMKMVVPIRKALGVRSVFNILGPLTNAAGAQVGTTTPRASNLVPRTSSPTRHAPLAPRPSHRAPRTAPRTKRTHFVNSAPHQPLPPRPVPLCSTW